MSSPLPRPFGPVRISPFHNGAAEAGRFLVEVGERGFVMNQPACQLVAALAESAEVAEVRRSLRERGGGDLTEDELMAAVGQLPGALFERGAPGGGIFILHFQLIRAEVVGRLARLLQYAFDARLVFLVCVMLMIAVPWAELGGRTAPASTHGPGAGWLMLGLVVSALAHELGHASACRRYGVEPGAIGFGLYWVFPVFYADVTRAWRLPPRQRVVVDLGGLYFQAVILFLALPLWWWEPALFWVRLFYLYNFGAMIHNLNPIFKLDGYWLLSDFARVPNLHRRTFALVLGLLGRGPAAGVEVPRPMKGVLAGYAVLVVGYIGYLAGGIPLWVNDYLRPGLRAGWSGWVVGLQHFQTGVWEAGVRACFEGGLAWLAVGLPLLLVPWALGKMLAGAWAKANTPARAREAAL